MIDSTSPRVRVSQAKVRHHYLQVGDNCHLRHCEVQALDRRRCRPGLIYTHRARLLTQPRHRITTGAPVLDSNIRFLVLRAAETYLPAPPPDS